MSPTCGPCRTLTPILNKILDEYEGKIHLVEIDIIKDPEIAQMGQVTGTPTVQFFRDQEMLKEMKGVKQKSEFRMVIENHINSQFGVHPSGSTVLTKVAHGGDPLWPHFRA